jgi:pimeloyl-ACP methyl ester carboxylesterase/DNA-binding CsgD family transcriptional regulator
MGIFQVCLSPVAEVVCCRVANELVNQLAMAQDGSQKIRFCTSRDGVRLGFATCGTGPTVIAAAHWISHLKLDWDNSVRRGWVSMLSRRHTLVRYDARGTGLSDRNPADFSLQRQIEDLEAVVEAAKCDRFALLGLWTGGAVAINYAVHHPERVTHLVLHACATRGRLARDPGPEQIEEAEAQLKLIEVGWANENSAFRQLHTSQLIPDATAEQARAFNDLMRHTTTAANAAKLLRAHWTQVDNRSLGPQLKSPTLVLHAHEDARVPFEEGRSLAAIIPGARFVPLESRNHILVEGEPAWQQLVAELDDFLPTAASAPRNARAAFIDDLTPRETDVLDLIAQGLDNATIGSRLGISERTARNHVSAVFSKLGVSTRAKAIVLARDAGFGIEQS